MSDVLIPVLSCMCECERVDIEAERQGEKRTTTTGATAISFVSVAWRPIAATHFSEQLSDETILPYFFPHSFFSYQFPKEFLPSLSDISLAIRGFAAIAS